MRPLCEFCNKEKCGCCCDNGFVGVAHDCKKGQMKEVTEFIEMILKRGGVAAKAGTFKTFKINSKIVKVTVEVVGDA